MLKRLSRALVAAVALSLLSGCMHIPFQLPTQVWHRAEPAAATSPKIAVRRAWYKSAGVEIGKHYYMLRPTITSRYIVTVDRVGTIEARDKVKGHIRWRAKAGKQVLTGPAVGSGIAVVVRRKGDVVAVDSNTRKIRWTTPLHEQTLALPVIKNGRVFVKTLDDRIVALSTKTGKILWQHREAAPNFVLRASGRPQVYRGRLIVGLSSGKVIALNTRNGKVFWQKKVAMASGANALARMVDIDADPVIYNGMVYVVGLHGALVAMDIYSGEIIWQHHLSAYAGLAVSARAVYVTDTKGRVYAFDRESGAVLWQQKTLRGYKLTGPAVQGQMVVVGSLSGELFWLAQNDGHISSVVRVMRRGRIIGSPVSSEGLAYVLTSSGAVAAYAIVPDKA